MAEKFDKMAAAILAIMALLTVAWLFIIQPNGPARPELASVALTLIFGAIIPILLIALIVKKGTGFKASTLMAFLYVILGASTASRGMQINHPFGQTTLIVGAVAVLLGLALIFAIRKAIAAHASNPFEEAQKVASS